MADPIKFSEFRSSEFNPIGHTTIIHSIRHRLNITLAEYCMMDFIVRSLARKKIVSYNRIYYHMGVEESVAKNILRSLLGKELIIKVPKGIEVTKKWSKHFIVNQEEFEEFYLNSETARVDWPGSRKDVFEKYKKARQHYSREHLMKCKYWYFKFLNLTENKFRKKMGGSVFLGLTKERFNENWQEQHDEIINARPSEKKAKPVSMTKKEKDEKFM